VAIQYEPEWECRRCHSFTRTAHRHCTWCGRYRFTTQITALVVVIVAAALLVAVHG
jgi:RNA polymerase subunit RPABC4/transcription elongation factor Spt4